MCPHSLTHDKTLKVLEGLPAFRWPSVHGWPAAFPLERSSRALLARRRRSAPSWPGRAHCSQSQSCARCVTSSASGRTYAAHSVDCSTDAAAVQPTASRWCDNLEREPEREPECGPSHVPWPQPDSWSRTRSWRCRRWRLPKRRSPRRIRKSSGRRGGRAGAEAEEGDEPGCEGVEALGVRWPRANPRVAVCFR